MIRKYRMAIVLAVVLGLVSALGACGGGRSGGYTWVDPGLPVSDEVVAAEETIKIGYVAPLTGPRSGYTVGGKGIKYIAGEAQKIINDERGGIEVDGGKKKVEIIWGDSESDPTKAQEVATRLVANDKVNMLFGEFTPATTTPVSGVGERNNIPTILANGPDMSWLASGQHEWSFGLFFDYDKSIEECFNGWDKMTTNKKIGLVLDTNVDSVGMAEILKMKAPIRGYTIFDPGRFPEGTKEYDQKLLNIQAEGCDILVSCLLRADTVDVWKKCYEIGYIPKTALLSKGMNIAAEVKALDDDLGEGAGAGITIETQWSSHFPWICSLNGKDAQTLSGEYEEAVKVSADIEVGWDWALFEVAADAFERAGTTSPVKVRDALAGTRLDTVYGHITFDKNNVGHVPIVFGQWVPDEKWGYRKVIIAADGTPEVSEITVPIYCTNYTSSK